MCRIALLLGQDLGYTRGVIRGVQAYGQSNAEWVFRDAAPDIRIVDLLKEWRPHGVIAHLFTPELADALIALGVPLVNTTSTLKTLPVPIVEVDHELIGRMAADHFIDRGFRHFGYFGSAWTGFSTSREAAFRSRVAERGFEVSSCHVEYLPRPPIDQRWNVVDQTVRKWIRSLPKPVAIFSSNDIPARELSAICRQLGLAVPDEVALLGVDDDDLECHLCRPPLSSIALPSERVGYEAAKLLDCLMQGRPAPSRQLIVPPIRLVTRQSTDTLAIDDPDLAAALAFIRRNASTEMSVDSIKKVVPLSRRALERKFRDQLGRSVLGEIRRVRLEHAKTLLRETKLPMSTVASRCGFSGSRRLATVFREVEGMTPTRFRAQSTIEGLTQKRT